MKKIIKHSGLHELFSPDKLCRSLLNSGADQQTSKKVCDLVATSVESGMTTDKIFGLTRSYLAEIDPRIAAIYSLDRGLSALGPSGFLFEQYVAAMLRELGYEVITNYYAKGEMVEHEIDVLAKKGNIVFIVEAKYRNEIKTKTHIDQVMYADARLGDIRRRAALDGDTREYYEWVVTNTNFTDHAKEYVKKRDVQLMGWDYPGYINLKRITSEKHFYPVTVLPSITKGVLKVCAQENLILVRHLYPFDAGQIQQRFGTSMRLAKKLEREIKELVEE